MSSLLYSSSSTYGFSPCVGVIRHRMALVSKYKALLAICVPGSVAYHAMYGLYASSVHACINYRAGTMYFIT
jgi:hypothetical protein